MQVSEVRVLSVIYKGHFMILINYSRTGVARETITVKQEAGAVRGILGAIISILLVLLILLSVTGFFYKMVYKRRTSINKDDMTTHPSMTRW